MTLTGHEQGMIMQMLNSDPFISSFDTHSALSGNARTRQEIAYTAARWIVEEGMDYASAKKKAAHSLLGKSNIQRSVLPDNEEIENEVRLYLALFMGDEHITRLRTLREIAVLIMGELAAFHPYLTGAILQGTATQHSDLYLHCFCENPKELAIYLINAGIQYEVSESAHFSPAKSELGVETLSFFWQGQWPQGLSSRQLRQQLESLGTSQLGVHLVVYTLDDERQTSKQSSTSKRLHLNGVLELLALDQECCRETHDNL